MYFVIVLGFSFCILGLVLKAIINSASVSILEITTPYRTPNIKSQPNQRDCYFDPSEVTTGREVNLALEHIFDIIIDRYILTWYCTLSSDPDFVTQIRMHLQYLSACLIHRAKSLSLVDYFVEKFIKLSVNHLDHIHTNLRPSQYTDPLLEDTILRGFGAHLHICLASRSTEVAYLRALVTRLLPHITLPPGLIYIEDEHSEQTFSNFLSLKSELLSPKRKISHHTRETHCDLGHHFPRSSSAGVLRAHSNPPMKLGANRAAYSFLVEILSTCVLLPAMDAVAHPDFINSILLQYLNNNVTPRVRACGDAVEIPVLNSYVEEWKRWMSDKPYSGLKLERLLQQPDSLFPFMRYMKSIKATVPVTAVLLMHDIDQRIRNGPLAPDSGREIRAQIRHVLSLIRFSANPSLAFNGSDENEIFADSSVFGCHLPHDPLDCCRLFDLPAEFDDLLVTFLAQPTTTATLCGLVGSPTWTNACCTAYETVEDRFVPLYTESPEYLSHLYGVSQRGPSTTLSTTSSPVHTSQSNSGIFGIQLKALFAPNTVEGRVVQNFEHDPTRPAMQLSNRAVNPPRRSTNLLDRVAGVLPAFDQNLTGAPPLNAESRSNLHSHYLHHLDLHKRQIDLSDWHVYVPSLCRPEVRPGRRLIDQLTLPSSPTATNSTKAAVEFSNVLTQSQYSARPYDGAFRAKVADELSSLRQQSSDDNNRNNRPPLLSSQFLYSVRTERMVNGVWQPIGRVDRKYSEFYVLEQKLFEFHGNTITRQLPRKQFSPRSFDFLESKRPQFEEYLQYLVAQPFLRNSELLHNFLTSKTMFSSNVLFELNLGRFAKSVPLKLIRERGQYLNGFLIAFYVSCHPQPIPLETVELSPSKSVLTITPGAGAGTVGGVDTLLSPDYQTVGTNSAVWLGQRPPSSVSRASTISTSVSVQSQQPLSPHTSVATANRRKALKPTWLDTRLRMKTFWNNAGLTTDRRKDLYKTPCDMRPLDFTGIVELPIFIVEHLIHPVSECAVDSACNQPILEDCTSEETSDKTTLTKISDVDSPQSSHVDPWDIGHERWSEALLNGPVSIPMCLSSEPVFPSNCETTPTTSPVSQLDVPESRSDTPVAMPTNAPTVSVSLNEVIYSLQHLYTLLRQHLYIHTQHFVLWMLNLTHRYFRPLADRWLERTIERYFRETLTDNFVASGLELLKAVLFYPHTPSTEVEKAERKVQAKAMLKQYISNLPFAVLADSNRLDDYVERLFLCFQQPKWNKQLSYVLLDQLVVSLFPELCTAESAENRLE